jgi:hypothetical protein
MRAHAPTLKFFVWTDVRTFDFHHETAHVVPYKCILDLSCHTQKWISCAMCLGQKKEQMQDGATAHPSKCLNAGWREDAITGLGPGAHWHMQGVIMVEVRVV